MSSTVGIVWNPSKIARSEIEKALTEVLQTLRNSGDEVPPIHWFETTEEDPGQRAASLALDRGCDLVIAAGGDGTVRAVAERLGRSGSPAADLGIVPLGTGNLLARNLEIPLGDPAAAFARALMSGVHTLDLGEVTFVSPSGKSSDPHGFVVMVGFGIDAQMIVETDDGLKAKAGWLAYVESLGRAVSGTEVVRLSLTIDDGSPEEVEAHTLVVANCGTLQGGITLLPDAEPDDGILDLLVLRADGLAGWLDTMRNMAWDNGIKRFFNSDRSAESSASTSHLQAQLVRAVLPKPLPFEIDGDDVGEVTEFTVRVLPSALRVRQ